MSLPIITVVMPIYNQENYCIYAIESVLAQTYPNIELIIVNDGSTDSSLSIIESKFARMPNVIIIDQINQGPSAAINAGLSIAQGEYIALCGGDDVCTLDRLTNQYEIISQSSSDIVFSWPYLINQDGNLLDDGHFKIFFNIPKNFKDEPFKALFLNGNFLCAPTAIFKANLIHEVGLFNPELIQLQDYDYWMRALSRGKKILISHKRILFYRRHTNNLSSNTNDSLLDGEYQFLFSKILDETPSDFIRANFQEILIPSPIGPVLSEFEKASILLASPLLQSKKAGLQKLLSLNSVDRLYLKERGINLFALIIGAFKTIEGTDKDKEIASLKTSLMQILNSTSWKITRPMRILKGLLTGNIPLKKLITAFKK